MGVRLKGAYGQIAAQAAALAPPDGYTLTSAIVGMMSVLPAIPGSRMVLDVDRDLTPVINLADLTLGYLNAGFFLGGRMALDAPAAERALARLGDRLSLTRHELAKGIFNVVNEAMAGAARVHIAEKAQDPRRFTMVATGGAGPVHAIGRRLQADII